MTFFCIFFNYINVNSTILQIFRNVRLQTKKIVATLAGQNFVKYFSESSQFYICHMQFALFFNACAKSQELI